MSKLKRHEISEILESHFQETAHEDVLYPESDIWDTAKYDDQDQENYLQLRREGYSNDEILVHLSNTKPCSSEKCVICAETKASFDEIEDAFEEFFDTAFELAKEDKEVLPMLKSILEPLASNEARMQETDRSMTNRMMDEFNSKEDMFNDRAEFSFDAYVSREQHEIDKEKTREISGGFQG